MDLIDKLQILGEAAKYDVSCASSGSSRKSRFGNTALPGICHSWTADGRCISLLKVLLDNRCIYNCAYCINSRNCDSKRASFEPHEICEITESFYRRNYIEGLFLSSGVVKSPDYTMERMVEVLRLLRKRGFGGYMHIKIIPGASKSLIEKAGFLADRMSVNVELPSNESLLLLAPDKSKESIFKPMGQIASAIVEHKDNKLDKKKFSPAGQSTQMIVGATDDNDKKILKLTQYLYNRYSLKRVYFSAYVPTTKNPLIPLVKNPPLNREHRLYQADWLLRFYGYNADELLDDKFPNFDLNLDPKCCWALRHKEYFPVEINKASLYTLLRVPGIGTIGARRIITARRVGKLNFTDLKQLGIVLKRAVYFITCNGKYQPQLMLKPQSIYMSLVANTKQIVTPGGIQTSMFGDIGKIEARKALTGSAL